MYHVLINGQTLYYPANSDYTIYDTELSLDIGLAGEFKFKVPAENPQYSAIGQGAVITILRDNVEYWRGEVKETSVDINNVMDVYCLEDLVWLADETIAPTSDDTQTYAQAFQSAIALYNTDRTTDKQFTVGYITNVNSSDTCNWTTEYEWSILDCLRECIAKDTGYLKVRRVTSGGVVTRYIDIVKLSDYGSMASQPIRFGVNLLDYLEEMKLDNFTNDLYPYGAETETQLYDDYNARLTGTHIQDAASIGLYGKRSKSVIFETDDLTTLNNLAQSYLTRYSQPQLTLKIDAIDLAEISTETHFEIGDSILVIAEPFAINQNLYLTEQSIDLQDISKNKVTLSSYISRGSTITSQNNEAAEALNKIPTKSSILDAAKKNVYNILTGENCGNVSFVKNADDQIIEIRIANNTDFDSATKAWRWNLNGLAYLSREYTTDPWTVGVAATMNGEIVADYITTGSLVANNGVYQLNMSTGKVVMKNGEFKGKIEAASGEIANMKIDSTGIGQDDNNLNTTRINGNGTFAFNHRIGSSWTRFEYRSNENVLGLASAGSTQGDGGLDVSGDAPGQSGSSWIRWGWSDGWRNDNYSVVWTSGSDKRLKTNIKELSADKVRKFFKKIKPIRFNYNELSHADSFDHYGVIAQDIEDLLGELNENNPYIVQNKDFLRKDENGKTYTENYKMVHYQELHGWELAGIKDLYSEIEKLKKEIKTLKGERNG